MRNIKEGYLTKLERKNPIGRNAADALSDKQIVEKLKEGDFLTDKLELTRRGKEYITGVLAEMDSVKRIMLELFILDHHGVDVNIKYEE